MYNKIGEAITEYKVTSSVKAAIMRKNFLHMGF